MPFDTSSFPAFLHSLDLDGVTVTTRGGRMIDGPPAPVFELALRLGLGARLLDTPRNRDIVANLSVAPDSLAYVGRRMRTRRDWRPAWEELARPHLETVEAALKAGDGGRTAAAIQAALNLLNMAYGGDGDYIHTPIREKRDSIRSTSRLYGLLRELGQDRVERLEFRHPHGTTAGLLHFPERPPQDVDPLGEPAFRYPALLALHGASGDKDSFDFVVAPFRQAGYATFCIDLPAHGESFDGPRLRHDDEVVGAAALDLLAAHPALDPDRLGVMGGSLGAFFAQRTAALSPRARACLAFASPFDIGGGLPRAVHGIQENFAYIIGAPSIQAAYTMAKPFHLRDTIGQIRCPLLLVHGTQDHICDFTVPFEVARRARVPLHIVPIRGADHEVAQPSAPRVVGPAAAWLETVL